MGTQVEEAAAFPATDEEARDRLVYWVRWRAGMVGLKSNRALAKAVGVPFSTLSNWLGGKGSGGIPLIMLGEFCRALKVEPRWFTVLPPIPSGPLAPYALADDDPLLAVLDAARLARRDLAGEAEASPPAAARRPSRPRKRASSGSR